MEGMHFKFSHAGKLAVSMVPVILMIFKSAVQFNKQAGGLQINSALLRTNYLHYDTIILRTLLFHSSSGLKVSHCRKYHFIFMCVLIYCHSELCRLFFLIQMSLVINVYIKKVKQEVGSDD